MYYHPTEQLRGFYGQKTVDEILDNQGGKIPTSRRATVAQVGTAHDRQPAQVTEQADKENTANKLKKVFSRRKSTM